MRIIHCADLHLDSKLEANLSKEQAKQRKGEILTSFCKMVDFASENAVEIILIAGDLFDRNNISATAVNTVKHAISSHPGIRFYYLKGNHDSDSFLKPDEIIPENLKLFNTDWISYDESGITVTGAELTKDNSGSIYNSLLLNNDSFNIVMLHGQDAFSSSRSKDKTETINIKALKNKGIDYLALGHIHAFKLDKIDMRGIYCYPGCLEGRGFDECGEHGFVLLDIDPISHEFSHDFIPFAFRRLFEIRADISKCMTSAEIICVIENEIRIKDCVSSDLIKIVLAGDISLSCEKDIAYILTAFSDKYFFIKIYDETRPKIDAEDFRLDSSLKGEFVRCILDDPDISEEDKPYVIKCGLDAILGEK